MKHTGFVICEDFLSQNAEAFISPRKKATDKLLSEAFFYTNNLKNYQPTSLTALSSSSSTDERNATTTVVSASKEQQSLLFPLRQVPTLVKYPGLRLSPDL